MSSTAPPKEPITSSIKGLISVHRHILPFLESAGCYCAPNSRLEYPSSLKVIVRKYMDR